MRFDRVVVSEFQYDRSGFPSFQRLGPRATKAKGRGISVLSDVISQVFGPFENAENESAGLDLLQIIKA
jgi:hypothetical protein